MTQLQNGSSITHTNSFLENIKNFINDFCVIEENLASLLPPQLNEIKELNFPFSLIELNIIIAKTKPESSPGLD